VTDQWFVPEFRNAPHTPHTPHGQISRAIQQVLMLAPFLFCLPPITPSMRHAKLQQALMKAVI
jgi:hypothetical protein